MSVLFQKFKLPLLGSCDKLQCWFVAFTTHRTYQWQRSLSQEEEGLVKWQESQRLGAWNCKMKRSQEGTFQSSALVTWSLKRSRVDSWNLPTVRSFKENQLYCLQLWNKAWRSNWGSFWQIISCLWVKGGWLNSFLKNYFFQTRCLFLELDVDVHFFSLRPTLELVYDS